MPRMKRHLWHVLRVLLFPMNFHRIINAITATAFFFRKVHRPVGLILALYCLQCLAWEIPKHGTLQLV